MLSPFTKLIQEPGRETVNNSSNMYLPCEKKASELMWNTNEHKKLQNYMSNNTYINKTKGKYTARSFQQNNACPPLPQIKQETLKTQEKI